MPLQRLAGPVHYLPGVTNAGVIIGEGNQAILIDTGSGDRSGRAILRALDEAGLRPSAIMSTHGHGDHTGGHAWIVERTGARVYAPGLDAVVLEQPAWGTICLFMGAEPPPELAVPRYAPRPCRVDVLVEEGVYHEAGVTIQAVPLHGHTGSHTGYLVEGVLFTGDAVEGRREMEAPKLSYLHSVTCQLATLEYLRTFPCERYLLAHDEPTAEIGGLLERNLAHIHNVIELLLGELAASPQPAADLLAAVCRHYGLAPRHLRDYALLQSTLHSYLGHLLAIGQARYEMADGKLLWTVA